MKLFAVADNTMLFKGTHFPEPQGYKEADVRLSCLMTPSRITDINLDCAYAKNTLVFFDPKLGGDQPQYKLFDGEIAGVDGVLEATSSVFL